MAENEDLAIRFYKVGDASDLADQLAAVLQSPKLEYAMAQQNFAAGVEMNITQVVSNYLRWFELNKCKKALRDSKGFVQPEFLLDAVQERSPV